MAFNKHGSLQDACPEAHCPSEMAGDVDAYDKQKRLSTIGFAVGVAGVAIGAVIILASSPSQGKPAASAAVYIGPGATGLQGRF